VSFYCAFGFGEDIEGFYVKNVGKFPPRIHDLLRMANLAKVEFNEDTLEFLDAVNTFNLSTRISR